MGFFADPIYGGNRDMVALEDDRLSRRALQLSRLDRPSQRTLSAAAREHHGPRGLDAEKPLRDAMARKLPKKDVVIIGLGWTGSILANELTDEGLDVDRNRARSVARRADRISADLCAG